MAFNLQAIGHQIRRARLARGLTQAQLAAGAHLTRTTLNQLENGLVTDLGICKVQAVLDQLGLALIVERGPQARASDFLSLASTAASVSFKTALTERELLRILLTGRVPENRRPHVRALLEGSPRALLKGLIQQVSRWSTPGKVERHLSGIATAVGLPEDTEKWLTTND